MGSLFNMEEAQGGDDAHPNGGGRPVFMPEVYIGVGREWSDWIEQFKLASTVNGWDEIVKLQFLALLLYGRAREMLQLLQQRLTMPC